MTGGERDPDALRLAARIGRASDRFPRLARVVKRLLSM
jgi:hypothetical protein